MIVTIDTKTRQINVESRLTHESTMSDEEILKHIALVMRAIADKIHPPTTPELIINEEREDDITEEMQIRFLTDHEGDIH